MTREPRPRDHHEYGESEEPVAAAEEHRLNLLQRKTTVAWRPLDLRCEENLVVPGPGVERDR